MYTPHPDIRRHPDGSLDFDFYRRGLRGFARACCAQLVRRAMARLTLLDPFMDAQSKRCGRAIKNPRTCSSVLRDAVPPRQGVQHATPPRSHLRSHCVLGFFRHVPLRGRLRHRLPGAEVDRHGSGGPARRSAPGQYAPAIAVRRAAQRHGAAGVQALVDAVCCARDRAQHLRAAREPRAHPAVLAVAPDPDRRVGSGNPGDRDRRTGGIARRRRDRARRHVPDQSLRAVRPAPGHQQPDGPRDAGGALQDSRASTRSCGIRSTSASSSRSGRPR